LSCAENAAEVRRCAIINCPLWPYRMGRNPHNPKRGKLPICTLCGTGHRGLIRPMTDAVSARIHVISRTILAVAPGSLWTMIFFRAFRLLAIAPGIALAALILLRPVKTVLGALRAKGGVDLG
jgi:hypothetical protein